MNDAPRKPPRSPSRTNPAEAVQSGNRRKYTAIFQSAAWKLFVTWGIIAILLTQLVKLFTSRYAFMDNPGPLLAVSFITAWFFRNPPKATPAWLIQLGSASFRGVFSKLWGILSTFWTIGILIFLVLLVGRCSQNPDVPFGTIVVFTLDEFLTGAGQLWRTLLSYFGF